MDWLTFLSPSHSHSKKGKLVYCRLLTNLRPQFKKRLLDNLMWQIYLTRSWRWKKERNFLPFKLIFKLFLLLLILFFGIFTSSSLPTRMELIAQNAHEKLSFPTTVTLVPPLSLNIVSNKDDDDDAGEKRKKKKSSS